MGHGETNPIVVKEGRFARLAAIPWWDQAVVRTARVLVVGAGALGNEVIKNLALLGAGHIIVADMDRIEQSNLCRSVLFGEADCGEPKATVAVQAATRLCPDIKAAALVGNVLSDVGLGYFRWADVVVGCLDNREARVFVNRCAAQLGRPWIDGGIEALGGIVRGFAPPATACYECTMSRVDWDLLNKRRSCSLLARQAHAGGGTPTTPTTASVIGALQAQEVLKRLHGLDALAGKGFVFEGLGHTSYNVDYPVAPDCPWHTDAPAIDSAEDLTSATPLRTIWQRASTALGGLEAIDLPRELVERIECPACATSKRMLQPIEHVGEQDALCDNCKTECVPHFLHSLTEDSDLLDLTVSQLGLPRWDILWARRGDDVLGIELAGDRQDCLAWS